MAQKKILKAADKASSLSLSLFLPLFTFSLLLNIPLVMLMRRFLASRSDCCWILMPFGKKGGQRKREREKRNVERKRESNGEWKRERESERRGKEIKREREREKWRQNEGECACVGKYRNWKCWLYQRIQASIPAPLVRRLFRLLKVSRRIFFHPPSLPSPTLCCWKRWWWPEGGWPASTCGQGRSLSQQD